MSSLRSYDLVHITDCHDQNPESGLLTGMKVHMAYSAWAYSCEMPLAQIQILPVEEFNTIDAGVKFSEMVYVNPLPQRLIVAVNVAPPGTEKIHNNERDLFVLGILKNGATFGGTYKGFCLSYIKPLIKEMYFLLDSNNGSQFRSLEVLPRALLEYAKGTIDKKRLKAADFNTLIPAIPTVSHVFTIDNFQNVKMVLSEEDENFLNYRLQSAASAGQMPMVDIMFAGKSVEFSVTGKPSPSQPHWRVILGMKMFDATLGNSILSLSSSSRLLDSKGQWSKPVAQVSTIRGRPHVALGFKTPPLGAAVYLGRD